MSAAIALLVFSQISVGAIVARVKEVDSRIRDLQALARMEIVVEGEPKTRVFRLSLRREGVDYRAVLELLEPRTMRGTKFLIRAERGKRNRQWAYFADLDLVREIPGRSQGDPFLGSHITYADLAGGAHLDDLRHALVGEEIVDDKPCYIVEGVPRRRIDYGKLRGWIRKDVFVNVKAVFYDHDGQPLKEAHLTDVRDLGGGALLPHRIEITSHADGGRTVLRLEDVVINQSLPPEMFSEQALSRD